MLPPAFAVPDYDAPVWTPIGVLEDELQRDNHNLRVLARLAEAVPHARAQAETESILEALSAKHPETAAQPGSSIGRNRLVHGGNVVPLLRDVTRHVRAPLVILLAASALLLVVACTNVSAIVLGIGIDREQELAVRGAIGAGRGRLVRQLLTENVSLGIAGGIAGIGVAAVVTRFLIRLAPAGVPRLDAVQVDERVLLATFTASALVGIGFGLVPAVSLTRTQPAERLRKVRLAGVRSRLHAGLTVLQLAMATLLLVGAGLLTRTLLALDAVDPGFRPHGLVVVPIAPNFQRFVAGGEFDSAGYDQYHDRFVAALESTAGIEAVSLTTNAPFSGSPGNNYVEVEGYTPAPGEEVVAERYFVSANYMDLLSMRILEGRGFTEADDRADAPKVTIVSETFVRRYFGGRSPLGKRVTSWFGEHEVIGVVADTRDRSLAGDDDPRYYMPRRQLSGQSGAFVLRVASSRPLLYADAIRRSIAAVDADVPVVSITSMADAMRDSLAEHRFRARLMIAFAALAGLFAVLGIYGVTSRSVASRTRELGIRMALGARRPRVMGMVVRQGVLLAGCGVALGLGLAAAATRVLAAFLYGVSPLDPATLLGVALLLTSLAALASLAPSRRAASVDPLVSLRAE